MTRNVKIYIKKGTDTFPVSVPHFYIMDSVQSDLASGFSKCLGSKIGSFFSA